MKIAVITGASSGLGEEFAKQMEASYKGIDEIWLIARRQERLDALCKVLKTPCRMFAMDLKKPGNIAALSMELKQVKGLQIVTLVNASGYGVMGNAGEVGFEVESDMLDVNVKALTAVTNICLPYLSKNSIVYQIASAAAFIPQPGFSVYAGSKAYVLSYALALREELRQRGVRVIAVCPGPVATEFFDAAIGKSSLGTWKKWFMAKKEKVVHQALKDAKAKKAVSVYGCSMKAFYHLSTFVPHTLLIRVVLWLANMNQG